tara:strand:+ start:934 stop:1095 length:162 start_codon:yes stop_codon:yes gene_type:complete
MENDKKWILLNKAKREIIKVLNWTTIIDMYSDDLRDAIRSIEDAQEQIIQESN